MNNEDNQNSDPKARHVQAMKEKGDNNAGAFDSAVKEVCSVRREKYRRQSKVTEGYTHEKESDPG